MNMYRYYCKTRPPRPGMVPPGAINAEDSDDEGYMMDEDGTSHLAWGYVEYDRELTRREMDEYDLEVF